MQIPIFSVWGGSELKPKQIKGRFCEFIRRVCPFLLLKMLNVCVAQDNPIRKEINPIL